MNLSNPQHYDKGGMMIAKVRVEHHVSKEHVIAVMMPMMYGEHADANKNNVTDDVEYILKTRGSEWFDNACTNYDEPERTQRRRWAFAKGKKLFPELFSDKAKKALKEIKEVQDGSTEDN